MTTAPPVSINGRAVVRQQIGGVERYAQEVVSRLLALRPERYRLLAPPPALAHRAGHLWEQAVLPLSSRGSALIYSPANLAPLGCSRNVVVIHDVAALAHPEAYSPAYVAYQRRMLPAIARRARLVLTVSEFSRAEIIERLGVRPTRITVIAPGVSDRFTPAADIAGARISLGIQEPYVLALGTASARKNHAALEPAARALRERGIELLLAGSDRGYLRGPGTGLRRLGYVPERALPGLYAGARALVMPSLYEGFGLPCIEAMACGAPVVAYAAGALPATCGDGALLVAPGDHEALSEAVIAAAGDEPLRARLIAAGSKRARRFSWSETAERTDSALASVLASGPLASG